MCYFTLSHFPCGKPGLRYKGLLQEEGLRFNCAGNGGCAAAAGALLMEEEILRLNNCLSLQLGDGHKPKRAQVFGSPVPTFAWDNHIGQQRQNDCNTFTNHIGKYWSILVQPNHIGQYWCNQIQADFSFAAVLTRAKQRGAIQLC